MSLLYRVARHSSLATLSVVCLAALTATSVFASGVARPTLATTVYGNPDAAVNGKLAVGSSTVGTKSFTVSGVIDFVGAGTVHSYFSQGGGNNMQINTNVDEANTVGDASKSQWKVVLGSSLDQFSIRRSPAGGTYNEDALFFINGSTGNVGIATVDTGNGASIPFTPLAKLHVKASTEDAVFGVSSDTAANAAGVAGASTATIGTTNGVWGDSTSPGGTGVLGTVESASGANHGVWGLTSSPSGMGVYGSNLATSGSAAWGVYGKSDSTEGVGVEGTVSATVGGTYGVLGTTFSTEGVGVDGHASATDGYTAGVYGTSDSTLGYGVVGTASTTTGANYGVIGQSQSTGGTGVYGASPQIGVSGLASATSGASYGVNGRSNSSSGYGVYGYAAATTGATSGVYGLSDSSVGHGVTGEATAGSGTGVFGVTDTTNGAGVFGFASAGSGNASGVIGETASSTGLAGYFLGDVNVVGTLSKTAGSFKIDDPLDPAHKYLQHSFVESPDMMNVYNGNVTLDDNGKAVVTMPDWFQALNQDFRYQLTAIGGPGPNLYVAEKMKDNQFRIAGGEPGMEVSWLVTGIRHDPYAEAHRVQVVVDKPADEQGTYLFPSLYDQPTSKGLQSTAQAGLNAGSVPPAGQAPTLSRQALPDEQVPSGSLP